MAVDGKTVEVDVTGSFVVINDPELVINAAVEGVGIAYLYEEYVSALIAEGKLVSLFDKTVLPVTDGFFLVLSKPAAEPGGAAGFGRVSEGRPSHHHASRQDQSRHAVFQAGCDRDSNGLIFSAYFFVPASPTNAAEYRA